MLVIYCTSDYIFVFFETLLFMTIRNLHFNTKTLFVLALMLPLMATVSAQNVEDYGSSPMRKSPQVHHAASGEARSHSHDNHGKSSSMRAKSSSRSNDPSSQLLVPASGDAEQMSANYVNNYDSLLNTFYMRRFARSSSRHNKSISATEFDMVPDSTIIRRLRNLRTIVPMTYNQEVRSYIRMYLNKMSTRIDVMTALCDYYHPMFEEVLNRYGVPEELKYLTIVESAMNPMATSRVGAAGLWQFMYHTGKLYDMEVNSVVDDRRDPYKSTVAAARYLRDLYGIFHDWTLAIAAYNCGPGNINKGIARSGGKRTFWEIYPYLPRETRGYIPALIAATYVMNYYPEHGLHPNTTAFPIHADTVMPRRDVLLCYVSDILQIDEDELHTLNPQYRVNYIPAESGRYSLTLPIDKLPLFIKMEDSIYSATADSLSNRPIEVTVAKVDRQDRKSKGSKGGRSSGSYHKVRPGETLSSIARKNGTSVSAIKRLNGIKGDKICVGQRLRVK